MVMCTLDGQQGCDGNVLMQQIYRIGECSKGQWAAWHRDPATIKSQPTPGLEKCWCKEKNKTVDATGNEQGAPALHPNPHSLSPFSSLSLLPETASLSPTAAKTMKHHTASIIFTYSPGLQHRESREMPRTRTRERREKRRNSAQQE